MKKIFIVIGIILLLLPTVMAITKNGKLCYSDGTGTYEWKNDWIDKATYRMRYTPERNTGTLTQEIYYTKLARTFGYERKLVVNYNLFNHTTVPYGQGHWEWLEGYNVIRTNDDHGTNAFFYKEGKCAFLGIWQWEQTPRYCEPGEVDMAVMDKYGDVVVNSRNIYSVLHIDESPYTASLMVKNGECINRRWKVCFYAKIGEVNNIIYENSERTDFIQREGYNSWCYYTTDLMNENEEYKQNLIIYPNASNGRIDIDVYDEFARRGILFWLDWEV